MQAPGRACMRPLGEGGGFTRRSQSCHGEPTWAMMLSAGGQFNSLNHLA
jgi:hypothetical protein